MLTDGVGLGWLKWTERVRLPSLLKKRAFTSPLVHLPSISSSLSRFIPPSQTHIQNETPPSCFIHPLSVFHSFPSTSLPLRWLLSFPPPPPLSLSLCLVCCFFLYKKSYSFLFQCVSQSVCQSLSVWSSSWLSGCRWKVGSPGGRPHQVDSEGWSPSPRSERT